MSNRRVRKPNQKAKRAPSDPQVEVGTETDFESPKRRRSYWNAVVFTAKMGVGLVLIVGAIGSLSWGVHRYAQTTPRFAIREIELEGTQRLVREDVLGAAGVEKGKNLFTLDVSEAEKSLLQSPWISSARVYRQLPGTVRIQVVEREPKLLALIGETLFLVSQQGEPFKELGKGDPHDLPIVTGISVDALASDRRAELARLEQGLGLVRDYEKLPLSKEFPLEELHLDPSGGVTLSVGTSGVSLHMGAPPWKRKLLRAERVLEKTSRNGGKAGVVFLDNIAHPERVVVRVR